jgi:hypothetical protein
MADEIGMERPFPPEPLTRQFPEPDPPDPTPPLRDWNPAMSESFFRTVVQALCVWAASKGWIAADTSTMLMVVIPSVLVFLATTAWGLSKQTDWSILKRAAQTPNVRQVVVADPIVAESVPDPKVTTGHAPLYRS